VTFPFQITMPNLATLAPDLTAEGNLRVTFRGQLYANPRYGMQPIPFTQTLTIPIPKLPQVSYAGTSGEPFSGAFQVNLQVKNPNTFPFTLTSVKSFLVINGRKYSLLRTRESLDFQSGETQPVVLRMETPPGKALSMALNLATNPNPQFNITGEVTFDTPYGWIFIPMDLQETLQ